MVGRFLSSAGLIALAAGVLACSKTQDTAPERRIFGNPPVFQNVDVNSSPSQPVTCDWTGVLKGMLVCAYGFPPETLPTPFPTMTVSLTYNDVFFQIHATDPDPPPAGEKTDILLVTASYLTNRSGSQPQEQSLIILDDGGSNHFDFRQRTTFTNICSVKDPTSCDNCPQTIFQLDSNDATPDDGLYSRGFAFYSNSLGQIPSANRASELYQDCLVSATKRAPQTAGNLGSQSVSFKIEAIDRAGNIATWPIEPQISIQPNSLNCMSDDLCACCFFTKDTALFPPPQGCYDLPGLYGQPGSDYDCGLCTYIRIRRENEDRTGEECGTCGNHKAGCPCFTDDECSGGEHCDFPPYAPQGHCKP